MLPPSLSNKNLPSQGGPITNEVEEGEIVPAPPASEPSITENSFAAAAPVSSEGTAAAPGNGVDKDNDVVMSDAPEPVPPPAAPVSDSAITSEANNSNGVSESSTIPVVQPPAPQKEEEKPPSVDMMDTSEDGPSEQAAEAPAVTAPESNGDIVPEQPPSVPAPAPQEVVPPAPAAEPAVEETPTTDVNPPVVPANDTKPVVAAESSASDTAMDTAPTETKIEAPAAPVEVKEETPTPSAPPASAAAQFLGGSSLDTSTATDADAVPTPAPKEPVEAPVAEALSEAVAPSASPEKPVETSSEPTPPVTAAEPAAPVTTTPAEPSSNGTETTPAEEPTPMEVEEKNDEKAESPPNDPPPAEPTVSKPSEDAQPPQPPPTESNNIEVPVKPKSPPPAPAAPAAPVDPQVGAAGGAVMGSATLNGGPPAPQAAPPPPPPPQAPPPPPQGGGMMGGMRELRVEDALLYLDDVKREFGGRPRVYNEFLAIMKNFKSQEVDTPGVIARVSKLFRGNNHLILGFNKFLPDGYKISMEDLKKMDAQYEQEQNMLQQQQRLMLDKGQMQQQAVAAEQARILQQQQISMQQQSQDVQMQDAQAPRQGMMLATDRLEQQRHQQAIPKPPKQPKGKAGKGSKKQQIQQLQQAPPQLPVQPPQPPQQQMQHQAVEFDHAISYVTTIKRRFANDQSTYHSFLEILHTYQKEQRGIKEVLEQVAHLFQDHPDLLKEFTFFLPDAVQEQAKERLHRAAAESESRLSAQNKMMSVQGASKEVIDMTDHTRGMIVDQGEARGQKRQQQAQILITYPQAPETFVYNSAVERQFFDAAKEALASFTRDGGQAWAEFMKCLDMYAQEILSKSEMLNLIEPLLGKRNNKLFEEFKRILEAAGGQGMSTVPSMEDSWYSVPLSEIDFSRCRKCGPSYRALPRDYPAPPCSQRSDEEAKVCNDVWVSLPVGSEESYTFRHMRRNTYEETLFRVEDERFEIDMTIDSNMCTLALLEPFAEEMGQLSGDNTYMDDDAKASSERKGLGGKRFRYTFDPNILGVIHRNSITRIYGDAGPQMLKLLKTNPTVAIPVVVKRLRQKDKEFRAARDYLNRHWREMAQSNYYKSLDHRGLTFRTTDKRAISNRTFLNDIKDRAANNGNESAAALQARIDKAKEEHGSFFATTMAKSNLFLKNYDLSKLPRPDRRLFTPDLTLMYENRTCIQKDVYRILSFALERGSISPTDKERCHRLWTEFLGPWFNLQLNWMLEPAVAFQESATATLRLPRVVSQDDNSHDEEEDTPDEDAAIKARIVTEEMKADGNDDIDTPLNVDHHPLPAGTTVSTIYGDGSIIACRKSDNMYVVKLPFGTATVRPSAVLCSVLDAEKSAYTAQRMVDDHTKLERPGDKLIIGTQSLYLFFRLHQILCRRIAIARKLAFEVKEDASLQTLAEPMPGLEGAAAGKRRYEAFLSLVYALLDGGTGSSSEGGKFEDRCRTLLGHWAFELATLDKVISHILKNIQNMANDDTMWSLVQLFRRHIDAGGFKPEAFRQEAAYLSDGEQMYAFQYCPIQKDKGDTAVLHIESLGVIVGSEEEDSLSDRVVEPVSKRQKR